MLVLNMLKYKVNFRFILKEKWVVLKCLGYDCVCAKFIMLQNNCTTHWQICFARRNYVIQFIMDQNIQSFTSLLISHFKGHYVRLSTLKCGSHVVEKFLKEVPESRQRIVQELLNSPQFEELLQDPFANYVIQSALNVTKASRLPKVLT